MTFEPNKEYGRDVLERTVDLTAFDAQFIPIDDLPDDHRYFEYQAKVNAGGSPTEQVINRHRDQFGSEYRFSTEGPHPIESLREEGDHDRFEYHQIVKSIWKEWHDDRTGRQPQGRRPHRLSRTRERQPRPPLAIRSEERRVGKERG